MRAEGAGELVRSESSGPSWLFGHLAGPVQVPSRIDRAFEHRVTGWLGGSQLFAHRWCGGELRSIELTAPLEDVPFRAVTPYADLLRWARGELPTLDLLASGGEFECRTGWTGLLELHGLVQLTLAARPEVRSLVAEEHVRLAETSGAGGGHA